jgi:hypothetical protein
MAEDYPDPGIAVNCPKCGTLLRYLATKPETEVYLYVCDQDGLFVLSRNNPEPVPLPKT